MLLLDAHWLQDCMLKDSFICYITRFVDLPLTNLKLIHQKYPRNSLSQLLELRVVKTPFYFPSASSARINFHTSLKELICTWHRHGVCKRYVCHLSRWIFTLSRKQGCQSLRKRQCCIFQTWNKEFGVSVSDSHLFCENNKELNCLPLGLSVPDESPRIIA